MHNNGDAAEQIVRLSLEGMETTVKITGTATKHLAVLLYSILKQEQKTRGKARLSSMIKSGKELKVFAIPQKDLETFVKHAKQYGILYCLVKDKQNTKPNAVVDIISRAEDAAKIQRIFDRFGIGKVEQVSLEEEKNTEQIAPMEEEQTTPFTKTAEKEALSERNSMSEDMQDKAKPSIKEKLLKAKGHTKQKVPGEIKKEVPFCAATGR